MQNRKKHKPLENGDLVECNEYSPDYSGTRGIIIERIHYCYPENTHPDEYSCAVKLLGSEKIIMVRAKWLKLISGVQNVQKG